MIDQDIIECEYFYDYYPPDNTTEELYLEEIVNNNYQNTNNAAILYINSNRENYLNKRLLIKQKNDHYQNLNIHHLKLVLLIILIITAIIGFIAVI